MNPTLTLLTALLLFPSVSVRAQSSPKDAAGSGYAVASRLEEFWESRCSFPCSNSGKIAAAGAESSPRKTVRW